MRLKEEDKRKKYALQIKELQLKSKIDIREKITIEDIQEESYYRVEKIASLLDLNKTTVIFHCSTWNLEYENIWKWSYIVRLITWKSLKEFINNRK